MAFSPQYYSKLQVYQSISLHIYYTLFYPPRQVSYKPISAEIFCIEIKQISMNFSRGILSLSESPHKATSSRRVPAANFGSLRNLFRTEETLTSANFRDG